MCTAHRIRRCFSSLPSPRGFTLIELMLVTFAITVFTGLAIPTFSAYNKRQNTQLAAKQLKTDLREAQIRSVTGGTAHGEIAVWGLRMTEGSGDYILFSCPAEAADISEYGYDCTGLTEEARSLKGTVVVASVSDYPGSPVNIIFKSFEQGVVYFHEDDGSPISATKIDLNVGVPGFGSGGDEERIVRVEAEGNVLDFKR